MAYAKLIDSLAHSGSRKADGTVNASGRAWFYVPGTLLTQTVYSNNTATAAITQPVTLDAAGKAVVYSKDPVRVVVEYLVSGTAGYLTVSDSLALMDTAGAVGVKNIGFAGPDGVAGSDTTLDAVLTQIAASVGGASGQFLESAGGTARSVRDKFAEIWISVKDFGAEGDGLTIDTTAIQAAVNRAGALGGGVVYFPPGTYLIDAVINVTVAGVSIRGSGPASTTIKQTNTGEGGFSYSAAATGFVFEGLLLTCSTSNTFTGTGLTVADGSNSTVRSCVINNFRHPISVVSGTNLAIIGVSAVSGSSGATGIALKIAGGARISVLGGNFVGWLTAASIAGCSRVLLSGGYYDASLAGSGFVWDFTGVACTRIKIIGCHALSGPTMFTFQGGVEPVDFYQYGNQVDGYQVGCATGAAVTPDRGKGDEITITASGGAGTCTVNLPTPTPARRGQRLMLKLVNAAGGAVTWAMNAGYVLVAAGAPVAPAGTDGTTTIMHFMYDMDTAEYREISRSNTTT